jgi:hypothetical protein
LPPRLGLSFRAILDFILVCRSSSVGFHKTG